MVTIHLTRNHALNIYVTILLNPDHSLDLFAVSTTPWSMSVSISDPVYPFSRRTGTRFNELERGR